jgi:hypothetical protein
VTAGLGSALRAWSVDDPEIGPNYSLHLSPEPAQHHLLFRGSCVEVRTPDPERALGALLRHLRPLVTGPGLAGFTAIALVRDGRATIVDEAFRAGVVKGERRLGDLGYHRSDAREVTVDTGTGEVVVASGHLVERSAFDDLLQGLPPARRSDPLVPPGHYPIGAWIFPGSSGDEAPSAPVATYRALAWLSAREGALSDLTDALRARLAETQRVVADPERVSELVDALR